MRSKLFILTACVLSGGCNFIGRHHDESKAVAEIHQMYARWAKAFEARDVDGAMAMYAPGTELTAYDIVPPLQYKGADAYRQDYATFFGQFSGPLQIDLSDTHIEAGRNVGFAYGLERLRGKLKDGTPVDMWMRWTDGLKRIDDHWRVVHEHISVPVDMATGKARLDLKP